MSNEHRIPDAETRARSVANLRELVKRWDVLIAELDELNASLEADIQNSTLGAYYKRRAERLAAQQLRKETGFLEESAGLNEASS